MNEKPTFSPRPLRQGDRLYLIDGSGYIFRAYHALPALTRKSDGLPVGAVHGFCGMLTKLLRDANNGEKPTHLAVIFDYSAVTFRNEIYPEYKIQRPDLPEDLAPQFGLIRQAVRAYNVPCVELEGYEADDLIATYARQASAAGAEVIIISSDKDLMQLVGPGVKMLDTMKDKVIGEAEVLEKFGVSPDKVIDVQALAGDSIDNVPGIPGIGVKTGAQLINEYGDLETLLQRAGEIKQQKRRERLIEFAELARISRQLVTLKIDVPVEVPVEEFGVREPDPRQLVGFLKALQFTTLTRRVAAGLEADPDEIEPVTIEIEGWDAETAHAEDAAAAFGAQGQETPQARAAAAAEAVRAVGFDHSAYETVTTLERLEAWITEAADCGRFAIDTETTSTLPMSCDLVGISLALEPGRACYIPVAHRAADGFDFTGEGIDQLDKTVVLDRIKPLLEDPAVLKIGHNFKYDWTVLKQCGIDVAPIDCTMLISYALDSGRGGHGMDDLSERHLGHRPIPFSEVAGTGKNRVTFDLVPLDRATAYAAEDADVTLRLWLMLKPRLVAEGRTTVYEILERPMITVLGEMERAGIQVDRNVLSRLSHDFAQGMAGLESEIHALAGESFNIGSPKQLGDILFHKMSLDGGRKTKTGAWGTGADVLEMLAAQGHDLPARVLDWRQLSKLKSTYTDALPGYIDDRERVHTCYALASTSTGRLSSSEPNLQNIPVRTEAGRKIRTAFVASPGAKLVSADYSQIELRVLAHIADIPQLKQAFAEGLDIHAMTASEMFNVPIDGMDPLVRRRAKAINFGIIYGISAFGLANQLAIPREEAGEYIKRYFERFPGIRDYVEHTKAFCRENGYVETLFGRRCHFPNITVSHPSERAFNERAAINAPIQGSAADIIRRAMIRMAEALEAAEIKARMLLQVHDELVFEAVDEEVNATIATAVAVMEKAAEPAVALKVPLQVDARAAENWEEAH